MQAAPSSVRSLADAIASVAVVIVGVVVSVATARLNDTAGEHATGKQQPDHRDEFYPHGFLSSIAMLVAICGRIPALLPPLMFFPTPMLSPALMLTHLSPVFPAARTAPIAIPIGLLNGGRGSDRWN